MKTVMEYVYKNLNRFNKPTSDGVGYIPVVFQDLPRDVSGDTKIDTVKIVYDLPNIIQSIDSKKQVSLTIDIWYPKKHIFFVSDLIKEIDKKIANDIDRSIDGSVILVKRSQNFILNLPDEDPNIKRNRMNYTLYFYDIF